MNTIEEQTLAAVNSALAEALSKCLGGYSSPLEPLIKNVIQRNSAAIEASLDQAVKDALLGDFREALVDSCKKKLAKVLISKMEGEIEKRANDLRSSPEFRARLVIAVTETLVAIKPAL